MSEKMLSEKMLSEKTLSKKRLSEKTVFIHDSCQSCVNVNMLLYVCS
jgi:hypothetical protein